MLTAPGQIAQLVEQRTENPRVGGSNPSLTTFEVCGPGNGAVFVFHPVCNPACRGKAFRSTASHIIFPSTVINSQNRCCRRAPLSTRREPLNCIPSPLARPNAPRRNAIEPSQHFAFRTCENDINRPSHKPCMHRRAARKHHDNRSIIQPIYL